MAKRKRITADRLRELMHYDPGTGIFTRLMSTSNNKALAGDNAGALHGSGYLFIMVDRVRYAAHQLAYLYMTGKWPSRDLDHRDRDKSNNRWSNLRLATHAENGANRGLTRSNKSGLKGAWWDLKDRKWKSQIRIHGVRHYLGSFDCPAAAHLTYAVAAVRAYGEFARVG